MQPIDPSHQMGPASRELHVRPVAPRQRRAQNLARDHHTQSLPVVNLRLRRSNLVLLSALSKKSPPRISCPILALRAFGYTSDGPGSLGISSLKKNPAIFPAALWGKWVSWHRCMSSNLASSATVSSPFKAARASLAENSGGKVLRGWLIEILLDTQRFHGQRSIVNYQPALKKSRSTQLKVFRHGGPDIKES